jgi:hypothetical protein
MVTLVNAIISVALAILDSALSLHSVASVGLLGLLYSLTVLPPSLAVGIRRLHNTPAGMAKPRAVNSTRPTQSRPKTSLASSSRTAPTTHP